MALGVVYSPGTNLPSYELQLNLNTGAFTALERVKDHQLTLPPHPPPVKIISQQYKVQVRLKITCRWIGRWREPVIRINMWLIKTCGFSATV